ncbi:DUF7331 family protein [Natrialbaceae archaeon AArc-T1-2]|uniref:DUF7331 family protein n=1 Tax=Natrialbaceae archaeon AArc-T1-2 TaxID=3053904 RepID=UPI00255A7673|nr:hypothetical protein [Natrialbaceae archaeon AArc-T1-2]WIV67621.1 hypothetical protein QQ977_02505 [Natrialbaceae archaeon AArc-T1-2]
MTDVSTRVNDDVTDGIDDRSQPAGIETIEAYETDDGVVFYDAENPLAWVETTRTLELEEFA